MARRPQRTLALALLVHALLLSALALLATLAEADGGSSGGDAGSFATDENGRLPDGKPVDWNNKHVIYTMAGLFVGFIVLFLAIVSTCAWLYLTKCPKMYT